MHGGTLFAIGLGLALVLGAPAISAAPLVGTPEILNLAHHGDLPDRTTHYAAIDDAGRFVAFSSFATDVLPGQPQGCQAEEDGGEYCILLYVLDREAAGGTGETWMVTNADGDAPDGSFSWMTISGDGSTLVFETEAGNLLPRVDTNGERDVYAYDIASRTHELISVCADGEKACGGDGYAIGVSHDGRYVSFESRSSDIASGDTDDATDVFVRDRPGGTTERVSVGPEGQETSAYTEHRYGRGISNDGRFVVFGTKEQGWAEATAPDCTEPTGSHSTGPCRHLYVHDRTTGTSKPLGLGPDGYRAESGPFIGFLDGAGTRVAYGSEAPILDPDAPEGQAYIEDLETGEVRLISTNAAGEPANADVWLRQITPDLRYAMLQTAATNLMDDEVVEGEHVYIKDTVTGDVWRLADPNLPNMKTWFMDIAPDLSWVSFLAHPSHQHDHSVETQKVLGVLTAVGEGAPSEQPVRGPEPHPSDEPMSTPAVNMDDMAPGASSHRAEPHEAPLPVLVVLAGLALAASIHTRKGG